jgi:hypothetical protein
MHILPAPADVVRSTGTARNYLPQQPDLTRTAAGPCTGSRHTHAGGTDPALPYSAHRLHRTRPPERDAPVGSPALRLSGGTPTGVLGPRSLYKSGFALSEIPLIAAFGDVTGNGYPDLWGFAGGSLAGTVIRYLGDVDDGGNAVAGGSSSPYEGMPKNLTSFV